MKDLLKDFLETSRDRIKTPITGSFALAFILWNWRPILILLFSDSSIEDRIKYINKNDCNYWALLAPLLIAIGYVTLVPYIMAGLEWTTKNAIERRKTHKANLTISDLDNDIEIAGKQFELEQVRSGQRDISELNDRITELNTQIETQNTQHKTQVENLNEQHKVQVEGYRSLIENYNIEVETLKGKINYTESELEIALNTSGFQNIINELTKSEQEYYFDVCKKIIETPPNKLSFPRDNGTLNKFIKLNLIDNMKGDQFGYWVTEFGKRTYNYLKDIHDSVPF